MLAKDSSMLKALYQHWYLGEQTTAAHLKRGGGSEKV
jgi:hypothetical protein